VTRMKIYVHFELWQPEFTLPIIIDSGATNRTVIEVRDDFILAYNAKFPSNPLQPEAFSLASGPSSKRKPLAGNQPIVSLVRANTDLFILPSAGSGKGEGVCAKGQDDATIPKSNRNPIRTREIPCMPTLPDQYQKVSFADQTISVWVN
jgi:hypothetical protein